MMAPLAIAALAAWPAITSPPLPGLLPLAGIACDSEAGERQLELGHRALDLAKPRAVEEQACATECASLDGCAFFHVMTSDGCMVEGGAKVCSPWAECTYFSECSPIKPDDEGLWTANVYVLRARAPASSGVGGNGPLPAAFFKRVGIDVATTLRAATAISNLITKGARRELAPHRRLDACSCETYATTGETPGDTGCWANAADQGDFRLFCCPGGQSTVWPGLGMECPTSRNTGGDSPEESAVAPGAGGSTTTACPEKPECTCENAWTGESPPCLAFRNECQTVDGQCNADGTVTPAGEVASPPPPSPGPSPPPAPSPGPSPPPPGRYGDPCNFGREIICGKACDPPVWCVTFDDDEAACNNAYSQKGDPADNGPYGKCKYDANRAGGKDDPKCYLEDKDYRCNDQEFTGITDADAGFDGAIDFVETADPAPAGATADLETVDLVPETVDLVDLDLEPLSRAVANLDARRRSLALRPARHAHLGGAG